jgi:hypothetical protein
MILIIIIVVVFVVVRYDTLTHSYVRLSLFRLGCYHGTIASFRPFPPRDV